MLNFGVADEFDGTCKIRFDDTNPETEEQQYVDAILDDIRWLGYEPGQPEFASDYFSQLHDWAVQLIEAGLAYVDDQDADTMSATRGSFTEPGTDSPWRERSVEENLDLFARMKAGEFAEGERVLRAKIDMAHPNLLMRDPVMYRIRHHPPLPHRRGVARLPDLRLGPTGRATRVEGTTHSLCTLEFDTHRPLYDWYMEQLGFPGDRPRQTEFARLNLTHTVLSKRKLAELVAAATSTGGTIRACRPCGACDGAATRPRRSGRSHPTSDRPGQRRSRDRAARVVRAHPPQRQCLAPHGRARSDRGDHRQLAGG